MGKILLTQKEFEKAEKQEKWEGDFEAILKAQHLKTVKAVLEAMDKILTQTEYQGVLSCWESNYKALKKRLEGK